MCSCLCTVLAVSVCTSKKKNIGIGCVKIPKFVISSFRHFVTSFLLTCQPHKSHFISCLKNVSLAACFRVSTQSFKAAKALGFEIFLQFFDNYDEYAELGLIFLTCHSVKNFNQLPIFCGMPWTIIKVYFLQNDEDYDIHAIWSYKQFS